MLLASMTFMLMAQYGDAAAYGRQTIGFVDSDTIYATVHRAVDKNIYVEINRDCDGRCRSLKMEKQDGLWKICEEDLNKIWQSAAASVGVRIEGFRTKISQSDINFMKKVSTFLLKHKNTFSEA